MPSFRRWAELPPDLIRRVGDSLDLKSYASPRGGCTAWRCALAPTSTTLLLVPDDGTCCPSAASLPLNRAFELKALPSAEQRVVGSSNEWLALAVPVYGGQSVLSLFNPITATEIPLPPLIHESSKWLSKVVFAPNPARDDFAAATICGMDRLAYVTAGARKWAVLDPVRLAGGDQLADLVYHEKGGRGTVYSLTSHGAVHVLHLPERRRREPIMDDEPSSLPAIPMMIPRWKLSAAAQLAEIDRRRRSQQQIELIRRRSFGPDLNAPATVEPLPPLPFDPVTSYAPPYNTVSGFTGAKNLVFSDGNMYQIWRNSSCTVTVRLPGGGRHRVAENEVFVLRYYSDRQPCWDAVTDLGGFSVFVGRNNAVSMYAEDVPGLKANSVYWIGGRGRNQGMVFDMATGSSTACLFPAAGVAPQSTICWNFLSDLVNICNNIRGGKSLSDPCGSLG